MKLNFNLGQDGEYHRYCLHCHAETVDRVYKKKKTLYVCSSCGGQYERCVVIDPAIIWWVDDDKEYWHESSGVFIKNTANHFLFFERVIFPFALTLPSGHVDTGETASNAAIREVFEEVGISIKNLREIAVDDVWGDQCRRGADVHRWHAYSVNIEDDEAIIKLNHEGLHPQWLTLDEALAANITPPVRYMINRYRDKILA